MTLKADLSFNKAIARRTMLAGCGLFAVNLAAPSLAAVGEGAPVLPRPLFRRALEALARHRSRVAAADVIGIADFGAASRYPRFHIVNLVSGASHALLVAHGRGSDPDHSGWLERFSNMPGSQASSSGAYLTSSAYVGRHGRSRRLIGLDPENSNAEQRAIVIHAANYVSPEIVRLQGKLGRSEGCFAFAANDLDVVLERLGPGRLIFADKLSA